MSTTLFTINNINALFTELSKLEDIEYVALDQGQNQSDTGGDIPLPSVLVRLVEEYIENDKGDDLSIAKFDILLSLDQSTASNAKDRNTNVFNHFGKIDRVVQAVNSSNINAAYDGCQCVDNGQFLMHFTIRR